MIFMKKHKFKLIGIFVFLLLMIFAFLGITELVYPDMSKDLYGNRLEDIDKVRINQDKLDKIKLNLQATGKVNKVVSDIKGRIINFIIDIKPDTDLITSKSFGDKLLEDFTEEEKDYYDFQIYVIDSTSKESELYPMIGYKHKTSLSFKWTNK